MSSFTQFLGENKIWWMLPIAIVLLAVAFVLWMDQMGEDEAGDEPFVYDMY